MNWNIIRHELFVNRKTLLIWTAIIAGLVAMFASFTPMIIESGEDFAKLLESYPKALLDAFNFDANAFTSFEGWMASEPYLFLALLLSIFAASLAFTAVSREVDQKTGEFLFILPAGRRTIFYSKVFAHFVQITLAFVVSSTMALLMGRAVGEISNLAGLLWMLVSAYLTTLGVAGLGYALTPFINGERTAFSAGAGFVVLSFLLKSLAGMAESIRWMAELSIFQAFDSNQILTETALPLGASLLMLGMFAAGAIIGAEALARKNLSM